MLVDFARRSMAVWIGRLLVDIGWTRRLCLLEAHLLTYDQDFVRLLIFRTLNLSLIIYWERKDAYKNYPFFVDEEEWRYRYEN